MWIMFDLQDWRRVAAFGYRLNDHSSVSFGYRAMGVDCSAGSFGYDISQIGPLLGITALS